jgi:hypothetical protein
MVTGVGGQNGVYVGWRLKFMSHAGTQVPAITIWQVHLHKRGALWIGQCLVQQP